MTTPTTVNVRLQLRADTAANWTAANPILLANEVGLETDTKKLKVGNGSSAWNSLAYFPSIVSGGTVLGNLEIGSTGTLTFEGSTADGFETTLAVTNPTADRTITLPNQSGTVVVSGNASIVDADIAANAEIAVSKLANGTANQVIVTDGTNVSWSDDLTLAGNLTVNGTTTTINTQDLLVEDKNIILGNVDTPTDVTADGGGITLKGATDKTINWVDATDAWTSSERFSVPLGSAASPSLTFTGDENTGIYSPGADQLALSTNGTQRISIGSDGDINIDSGGVFYDATNNRLAIGTTSPDQKLTINNGSYSANIVRINPEDGNREFLIFGVESGVSRIRAGGAGSFSNELVFETASSGTEGERARIDSSGRLLVGTSSTSSAAIAVIQGNASIASPGILCLSRRNTAVNAVDGLGSLYFSDVNHVFSAEIGASRDGGTWTPGVSLPTKLVFSTTADGASSPTEQVRITSDRYVRLASGTGGIQFGGDTAAANALDDYEEGTWTATLVSTDQPDITATGSYRKVGAIVYFTVPFVLGFSKTITPSRFDLPFTTGSRQVFSGSVMRSDTIDPKQTISAGTGTGTSGGTFGVYLRTNDGSALTLTLPGTYTTRLNISGVFNV